MLYQVQNEDKMTIKVKVLLISKENFSKREAKKKAQRMIQN
jgi:hypothetical protein